LLRAAAEELPEAFENESFDFWQRYLKGAKEPRPRANRCAALVTTILAICLAEVHRDGLRRRTPRRRFTQLVEALDKSLESDIQTLPWMTDATKKAAIVKLHAITNNVGYPKKWSRLQQSEHRARRSARQLRAHLGRPCTTSASLKIGQPTDKTEWYMTTPTVNAFYSSQNNSINFPAGILQPPFFDPQRDIAINYGGIGSVIGHEMTHGFDDQGRKFDADGNLRDWWTPQDGAEFEKRAACIADEHSGFTAVDDVKLNGRLTLGENTADNGGVRVALMALEDTLKGKQDKVEGYTPEQRFFLGFAQVWCENMSPQESRQRAMTDPHSPAVSA